MFTQPDPSIDFQRLFALSPEMLCVLDPDGRIIELNPAWEQAVGFTAEELVSKSLFDLVHEEDREAVRASLRAPAGSSDAAPPSLLPGRGAPMRLPAPPPRFDFRFICRFLCKDAKHRLLDWSATEVPGEDLLIATVREVTLEHTSLRRFKALLDATPDFIAIVALAGGALYINPAGLEMVGRAGQEARDLHIGHLFEEPFATKYPEEIRQAALEGRVWSGEAELHREGGESIPVSCSIFLLRDDTEAPESLAIVATDLRERKRREAHARELKALMDAAPDLVGITTLDSRIMYMNPAGLEMVGRTGQDLTSLRMSELLAPADLTRFERDIVPVVMQFGLWAGELRILHRDGTEIVISQVILLIRDDDGAPEALATMGRDLSEPKRMEAALQRGIRALATPILSVWEGVIALPVIGRVDNIRAAQMMDSLLPAVASSGCRVAILDLTGVSEIDAPTVSRIVEMISAVAMLGSRCIISGISPGVAQTLASLDLVLTGFRTARTLEDAIRIAIKLSAAERRAARAAKGKAGRPRKSS